MAASEPRSVLLVEDEAIVAHDLRDSLADLGYDAFAVAASAEEALARATERRPDVALVDIRIKGRLDGIQAAQLLYERYRIPIVYLTAHADGATLERALRTQPYAYLLKPVKPAELRSTIEIALRKHESEAQAAGSAGALDPAPDPRPSTRDVGAPEAGEVRRAVEGVLASPDFDAPRRSREFLSFIVEEALSGRDEAISQATIAIEVFGRKDDFDALTDPIVRIQAGRLRRSLERYYLLSGKHDAVRIELPRGSYVPVFNRQAAQGAARSPQPAPASAAVVTLADDWPVVLVSGFKASTLGESEAEATRMTEELALELGRYRDVRVRVGRDEEPGEAPGPDRVRFSLGGRLRREDGDLRVTAHLLDRATGEQVWGDEYHTAAQPGRWSGHPDDIARVIAARVGSEEGVVVQLLAAEARKRRSAPVTPYGALLLAYDFFLARDPETLAPALAALHEVVKADPDCGAAWTRLARVCLANYAFEVTKVATPIDEAITCAQRGVRLDPADRRARGILASCLLVKGEVASARTELEDALRLAPDSLVYLEIIGYLLTFLGDEERGPALIRAARQRNPHCLPHALFGVWHDHLRRGELELAYQTALEYRDPTFFWRGVMRASCLGLLGRTAEARAEVAEVMERKPDFTTRGRTLIGYYVKSADVMDRIVDGLARAGLRLA
jgi:CheY-like chemotaxis protein/TolB-like protein